MQTFYQFLETKGKTYDFSSVLYLLPNKEAKEIYDWGLENVPDKEIFRDPEDVSFGREDEIHCTVLYGIHDKNSLNVRKILSKIKPFEIKLGKITAFNNEKFDVLKVSVIGPKLHKLHHQLKNNLKVTESYPEYRPHVTIAYLEKGKAEKHVGSDVFEGVSLQVNKVVFSSSSGIKTPIPVRD